MRKTCGFLTTSAPARPIFAGMNAETKSPWLISEEKWARRMRDRRQMVKAMLLTLLAYFVLSLSDVLPPWLQGEDGYMIFILGLFFPLSTLFVALGRRRDALRQ